ncbi:tRNA lysidine(34) synthetase TilS [Pseudoxanthomonas sp. UTMC 1351]|uniref:tRNA lysidine(34) synthetase TilS n=1 Tax=Pseudoxanthomonas sp. UTMC 1351 TaxID=2695853 RepID=UPI0034CF93CB
MTDPTSVLRLALRREEPAPILAALSGGLDSCALLHALVQDHQVRQQGLSAIHIHHGLHAAADEWAAHCATLCRTWGIPLNVVRVHVERDGEGLEAAARRARYLAFAQALGEQETLVTAHHLDDQAETFLLRALRASGPEGLAAIRPWRRFAHGWHWRPLLDVPRKTLLAYAQALGLAWVEDPSNEDSRHDRNFLRHQVLPLLRQRWPQADAAFARSASLMAETVELLEDGDAQALAMARTADPQALSVAPLAQLPRSRRARVLRRWIAELGLPPLPSEGVARIESDLLPAGTDTAAEFAWNDAAVQRWRGLLFASRHQEALPPDWQAHWRGDASLSLPGGGSLVLEGAGAFIEPLRVSARQGGERITLPGRNHSHELKKVLQELGVPPWERRRLPLLWDSHDRLLAAGDLICSAEFDAWLRQNGATLRWRRDADAQARHPSLGPSSGALT